MTGIISMGCGRGGCHELRARRRASGSKRSRTLSACLIVCSERSAPSSKHRPARVAAAAASHARATRVACRCDRHRHDQWRTGGDVPPPPHDRRERPRTAARTLLLVAKGATSKRGTGKLRIAWPRWAFRLVACARLASSPTKVTGLNASDESSVPHPPRGRRQRWQLSSRITSI